MASLETATALLAVLSAAFPTLEITEARATVWADALGSHSVKRLMEAARWLVKTHRHGAPSPANLLEYLEGRIERVPVPVTDVYNRKILGPDGTPRYTLEQRRVFLDGSTEPLQLPDPGSPPRPRLPAPRPSQSIGDILRELDTATGAPREPDPGEDVGSEGTGGQS